MITPQLVSLTHSRGKYKVHWYEGYNPQTHDLVAKTRSFDTKIEAAAFSQSLKCDLAGDVEYVYLLRAGDNDLCKIGYSANPERRITDIQQGTHKKLRWGFCVQCTRAKWKETMLKIFFAPKNIRGEWFRLNSEERKSALRFCLMSE